MNSELMETWGKFLITTAQLQEQFERLSQQLGGWCESVGTLAKPWTDMHNLGEARKERAASDPNRSGYENIPYSLYGGYMKAFGLVPLRDYMELARKHEELKNKCAALEALLKELTEPQGSEATASYESFMKRLQECAVKQAETCRELIDSFSRSFPGVQ
jgi:cell division septum initiation protein DivIVA